MKYFGKFTAVLMVVFISIIINSFVVTKLWIWFIVPTFDVNPLRMVEAIGLMFLVIFVTTKQSNEDNENTLSQQLSTRMIYRVTLSAIVLLFGWITQMFM